MARICWGRSTDCFIYSFVIQVISEVKVLPAIQEIFSRETNCNYNSCRFSCESVLQFNFFLSFLTNQKQESGFQQVVGLVTRKFFVFCLYQLHSTSKLCWIQWTFIKFLHVIPVCIIAPWFNCVTFFLLNTYIWYCRM